MRSLLEDIRTHAELNLINHTTRNTCIDTHTDTQDSASYCTPLTRPPTPLTPSTHGRKPAMIPYLAILAVLAVPAMVEAHPYHFQADGSLCLGLNGDALQV